MTITDKNTSQLKAYYISDTTDTTEWSGNSLSLNTETGVVTTTVLEAYWEKYATTENFTLNCNLSGSSLSMMGFKTPEGNRLLIGYTSAIQQFDSTTDTLVIQLADILTGEFVFSCVNNTCILKDLTSGTQYDSFTVPTGSQFMLIGGQRSASFRSVSVNSLTYQSSQLGGSNTEDLTTDTDGVYDTGYLPIYYGDRSLLNVYDGTSNYNASSTSNALQARIELPYIQADFTGFHELVQYNRDVSWGDDPSVSDGKWYSGTYIYSRWDVQPIPYDDSTGYGDCMFRVVLQSTSSNRFEFGFHDPNDSNDNGIHFFKDVGTFTVRDEWNSTSTEITMPTDTTTYLFTISEGQISIVDETHGDSVTYPLESAPSGGGDGLYFWIRKWSSGNIIVSSLEYHEGTDATLI